MFKRVKRNILIIAFLILSCNLYAQINIIHDIPWHSDTVGMWGPGSQPWSINQVDTLADFSIGPYGNQYSFVYDLPWPSTDSVGAIFDYGFFLDMQLIFAMTGWQGGEVKVNYPTKIDMDFPANYSFTNGDWVTIASEYRELDTTVYGMDNDKWHIYADFPDAGKIHLFLNMEAQANIDLIFSDVTDPFNITWDTLNIIPPVNIDLDTFDIFLIDIPNGNYVIPWVWYHTDPFTGNIVIDSVGFLHSNPGWPLQFPAIFYNLIGISGDISIPDINNYHEWIVEEQRLYSHGYDEYLHINLDIVKFVQVMCHYLSYIPALQELEAVSQMIEYEEGDTSIYLFTDPLSGEDFTADFTWDLIDAELWFTSTMHQNLAFCDIKEYSIFGIPVGPPHYPNVWNILEFPVDLEYKVLDTLGLQVDQGVADSIKYCADYNVQLKYPCEDLDSLNIKVSHSIDPWFTNVVRDSVDVDFYIKVLDIDYSIGTPSNPIIQGSFLLYEDTLNLGSFAGIQWFGPVLQMPWELEGYFPDTTFVPDVLIFPINNPLHDSIVYNNVLCWGTNTGSATAYALGGEPPYTYIWTDGTDTLSTTSDLLNAGVGTYYLYITDNNGCFVMDSVNLINLNPPIFISSAPVDVLCNGDSTGSINTTITGGTPGYTYAWTPNVGSTATVSNLPAGTYIVVATDAVGCTIADTITIIEPTPIVSSIIGTNILCHGYSTGAADLIVSGGVPPYTYAWSNAVVSEDLTNIPVGLYIVTITDANQCAHLDSIDITEPQPFVITVNPNTEICFGSSADLWIASSVNGANPIDYLWSNGVHDSLINVSPAQTTTYFAIGTDANGCPSNTDTVLVSVIQPLAVNLITNVDSLCPGDLIQINAILTGGHAPYSFTLPDGTVITMPYFVTPLQTTTYVIYISDSCQPMGVSGNVTVHVMPKPNVNISSDIIAGCEDLTVSFTDDNHFMGQTYVWDFHDGTYAYTQSPVHTFQNDGSYDITLTVTNIYGCDSTFTIPDMITVYPRPIAIFTPDPAVTSIIDPTIIFYNNSINYETSHWHFGDGSSSDENQPQHTYGNTGVYTVQLTVTNIYGCSDSITGEVTINNDYTFYAPNAFTPNEDGYNEIFNVYGTNIDPNSYHLYIYDRWGGLVFESDDMTKGWDGTFANGTKIMKNDVFVWMATFKDISGLKHKETGTVTLLMENHD